MTTSATPAQPTAQSDLVFGRYQIIRRLAVGGMGEVFLARQSGVAGFDRLVILKSLLPDLASQEDFVNQFLDEARVAATLNHPNIVSIYEVGLWNGTYFIAMEYIRGDNLSRLQRAAERAKTRIPLDVAAFIIHDSAHALDHAHKAVDLHGGALNIVHRDVSPQNIMVRTDGVTKVVDFGIAKAANRSSRTATGLLKGKVQYMAPEQVQGQELDGRADQFALGVVLWEMVAGKKLFQGNNDIDVLRAVISSPIPKLSTIVADIPPALDKTVDKMLARDRNQRYPTLLEAAADLKRYLDAVGIKNAQQNTAAFVGATLGEEIQSKTIDLTPSKSNNFVIDLAKSAPPPTSPTAESRAMSVQSKAKVGVAAGLMLSLALAGVGWWLLHPPIVVPPAPGPGQVPKVLVETKPDAALILVDGKEIGKAPQTVNISAGFEHVIEARADGYEPHTEKVKLALGEMKPFLIQLDELKAKLSITANMTGADVKIDGKDVGKAPLTATLAAGPHTITASMTKGKDSYTASATSALKPGESATRDLQLTKVPAHVDGPAPCPAGQQRVNGVCTGDTGSHDTGKPASFTLDTKPWAKLYVDGRYVDSTPVSKVELPAGVHKIHLVNEASAIDETRTVTLKSGESFKQSWQLKAK